MHVRQLSARLIVFCCLLALITSRAADADARRPNVIFILADQWRAQATGYAADPNVKTPNLDRLEAVSVNFTHAVSGTPVCSPCRASLITGQRPTTHGVFLNDAHLSDDAVTLAKVMSAAGYDTALIGKWHLNGRGRLSFIPPGNRQGFQYWKAMECTHEYNHSFYFADTPERLEWPGYDAFAQTKDAVQYIRDHAEVAVSGDAVGGDAVKNATASPPHSPPRHSPPSSSPRHPFLLCLWFGPPHNPYETAPDEFRAMYDRAKIQLRPNVPAPYVDAARKDLAGYYAHCSAIDKCVGDIWQALRDAGIERDTILIFSSDHGDMLFSHGLRRKQQPWDESLRVPMLWHYPAGLGDGGKRLDAVISSEDVMPTMLSLCAIAIPPSVEGIDYSGQMKGGENPNRDNAALIECVAPFGEWNRTLGGKEYRGVRTTRYTYARDLKGPWLLFDDERDPYQQDNLVGKPEAAEVQSHLEDLLKQRLKSAHDEFKPAEYYLTKWGYKDRVNKQGSLPTTP